MVYTNPPDNILNPISDLQGLAIRYVFVQHTGSGLELKLFL
jgi:hypothetical protein